MTNEFVSREAALWTFDIKNSTWQQMHATGDLPTPDLALGLAIANGYGYLLVNEAEKDGHMGVYELDLQQWQWRKVPLQGHAPQFNYKLTPVVVQVCRGSLCAE